MTLTQLIATVACGLSIQVFAADKPVDVEKYLETRESCDHWRGEYGYDKERESDINWFVCKRCKGIDAELVRLKKKYDDKPNVMAVLKELEPEVEQKNRAEADRLCKATRKPKWYR